MNVNSATKNDSENWGDGAGDAIAFPVLTPAEIDILRRTGEEVTLQNGEAFWNPGDVPIFAFSSILEGGCIIGDSAETGRFGSRITIRASLPAMWI